MCHINIEILDYSNNTQNINMVIYLQEFGSLVRKVEIPFSIDKKDKLNNLEEGFSLFLSTIKNKINADTVTIIEDQLFKQKINGIKYSHVSNDQEKKGKLPEHVLKGITGKSAKSKFLDENELEFVVYHFLTLLFEEPQIICTNGISILNPKYKFFSNYMNLKRKRLEAIKKCHNSEFIPFSVKKEIMDDWFATCSARENEYINLYFIDKNENSDITREQYIDIMVFENPQESDNEKKLSPLLNSESMHPYLEHIIKRWYMVKYDLDKVRLLYKLCRGEENKSRKKGIGRLWIVILIAMILTIFDTLYEFFIINQGKSLKEFLIGIQDSISFNILSGLFILIELAIVIYIGFRVYKYWRDLDRYNLNIYNLALPRFIGAIALGYVPVIWSNDILNFFFTCSYRTAAVIIIVSLIVAYTYIKIEVSNGLEVKLPAGVINKRINNLFIKGITRSMAIGLFLTDVFSGLYLRSTFKENITNVLPGSSLHAGMISSGAYQRTTELVGNTGLQIRTLFGVFYLKMYLILVPLALMLGLLLQILWEDKEITYPL